MPKAKRPSHETAPLFVARGRFGPGRSAKGTIPAWVIAITLHGAVRYNVQGSPIFYGVNEVSIIRPHVPQHWMVADDPSVIGNRTPHWECIYAIVTPRPHWHPWLSFAEAAPGYIRLAPGDAATARRVRRAFLQMHRLGSSGLPERVDFAFNALERALLWLRADQTRRASPLDPRVSQAIEQLTTHLARPVSLEQLAHDCHASRSHLAYLFEKQVGLPPMRFLERQRMDRATQMLRFTPLSIKEIAAAVGFDDVKYFAKRFKRQAGRTPRQARRER